MMTEEQTLKRIKFGLDVQAARLELGVKVGQLDRIIHAPKGIVSQVERLGGTPKCRYFQRLCEELGLIPEDYYSEDDC